MFSLFTFFEGKTLLLQMQFLNRQTFGLINKTSQLISKIYKSTCEGHTKIVVGHLLSYGQFRSTVRASHSSSLCKRARTREGRKERKATITASGPASSSSSSLGPSVPCECSARVDGNALEKDVERLQGEPPSLIETLELQTSQKEVTPPPTSS